MFCIGACIHCTKTPKLCFSEPQPGKDLGHAVVVVVVFADDVGQFSDLLHAVCHHGGWLEIQYCKGGIPTATPLKLASQVLSLPPILYMQYRIPVPNWSKAPWGLSVLARVTSIFTGTSISPDALSRQCSNHYAFRAGRNLPDKEFRYLRTVIVTAAVYWGLNSKLRCLTSPLNLPAPGRRQPIYLTFRFRIDLCFC